MNIVEQTIINIFKLPKLDGIESQILDIKHSTYSKKNKNKNQIKKKGFLRRLFKKKTVKKNKWNSKKGISITRSGSMVLYNHPLLSKIPRNAFGVFVTVHRELDKLKTFPHDIHGCIGHWNHEYNNELPETIYENIIDVSLKATFEDDRRQNFPPLENDVFSTIEINYLLTPLYKILTKQKDGKTIGWIDTLKKEFDNNTFGLIVDGNSSAIYLPKVFEKVSWNEIKDSLLQKAGLSGESGLTSDVNFYAYLSEVEKEQIFDLIHNKIHYPSSYPKKIAKCFTNFIKDHKLVPYNVGSTNKIFYNKEEIIRNLSVLETFLELSQFQSLDENIKSDILKFINTHYSKIDDIKEMELANLVSIIFTLNKIIRDTNKDKDKDKDSEFLFPINEKYIKKLVKRVKVAEKQFERGQIILALLKFLDYETKDIEVDQKTIDFIIEIIEIYKSELEVELKSDKSTKLNIDSVFKINWDSQTLHSIYKFINKHSNIIESNNIFNKIENSYSFKDEPRKVIKYNINNLLKNNLEKFKRLFSEVTLEELRNLESNFLVVSFEGLMSIFKSLDPRKYHVQASIAFKLFLVIMSRFKPENGLIYFKTNEARLDITGHFLNAF
jgi:AMMECR1 domain-containing protein